MAKVYKTPGVYIEEKSAFPGSIEAVETAVPAFIGYTAIASRKGKSLKNKPVKITSFKEYTELFGDEGLQSKFTLAKDDDGNWDINFKDDLRALLFESIKLFYANGGGNCYIVSVGTYGLSKDKDDNVKDFSVEQKIELDKQHLIDGINTLLKELEPTMLVIPDALLLDTVEDCNEVYKNALNHCKNMQNRVAILDVYNGNLQPLENPNEHIVEFRETIGTENLEYASAYYPWLDTNIYSKNEVNWTKIDGGKDTLKMFCTEELSQQFIDNAANISKKFTKEDFHKGLLVVSPTYANICDELLKKMNQFPTAPAIAGIYTIVDNNRGVWKAPANIGLSNVVRPTVNITYAEQEELNVDAITGKSINAIRTFPGKGILVWGGRTLQGNSLDWRYINVRRTMIMLEQSIKLALKSYVFEPNDANTWVIVKSMIANFLTKKWKQGALAGSTPEDAFDVQIGLGTTMTATDMLEGIMRIEVKVAVSHPAEFIVITFQQQMQKA